MPAAALVETSCEKCYHLIVAAESVVTVEGERLCRDCAAKVPRCGDCDRCSRRLSDVVGGGAVCDDCADNYSTCDDCGYRTIDTCTVDGGNQVCATCEDEDYHTCADCSVLVPRRTLYCDFCEDNGSRHCWVYDYDYKPEPLFHGDGPLFLGLELELKTPHQVFDTAVETAVEHLGDLGYLKEDSSIRPCGFELVTHPMSYDYAVSRFPWPLLNRLRLLGAYTDDAVGIHVHLSRAGFASPAHVYRWLKFVYRNEDAITTLARRHSSEWAEFSADARAHAAADATGTNLDYSPRYQAINVRPEHTFELRVFASSLRPRQVQAALAFAAASVDYTRHLTAVQIARRGGWEWSAFTAWVRTRPHYSPLLAEMEALACAS